MTPTSGREARKGSRANEAPSEPGGGGVEEEEEEVFLGSGEWREEPARKLSGSRGSKSAEEEWL